MLKSPLTVEGSVSIPSIEFAQPGGSDSYDTGFQHIEFLTVDKYEEIIKDKSALSELMSEGKFGDEAYLKWPDKVVLKLRKLPVLLEMLQEDDTTVTLT